jgi:hypothetical protein
MHHRYMPDVFEISSDAVEARRFPWVVACAVAAIVIGASMVLVAAHEDAIGSGPQVAVVR